VNCYAERAAIRQVHKAYAGFVRSTSHGPRWTGRVELVPKALDFPLRLKKPSRIFVNSMSDLFHEALDDEDIDAVFLVMAKAERHTFQILTKRPARMRRYMRRPFRFFNPSGCGCYCHDDGDTNIEGGCVRCEREHLWPLPNVWAGTSVENRATLSRIDDLRETPAAIRFVSFEPLLEDLGQVDLRGIHHAILGGESGPGARPCNVEWIRSLLRQCRAAGVAPFVKQLGRNPRCDEDERTGSEVVSGAIVPVRMLKDRKGGDMAEWPEDLRVREQPA
jgi:protein gp37